MAFIFHTFFHTFFHTLTSVVMITLESIDFKSLIAKETHGRIRVGLMALSHITDGANNTQTARNLQSSRRIINDWVKRFYKQGLEGLNIE